MSGVSNDRGGMRTGMRTGGLLVYGKQTDQYDICKVFGR